MTKEEAKEVIQRIRNCVGAFKPTSFIHFPVYRNTIPALDMAIQALSQEPICDRDCEHCTWTECPIEPCDDAVSRPTVVKFEGTNMACMGGDEIMKEFENNTQKNNDDDVISRKSIKQKLQEHHDFFVNAYGGFSNLPQNDKARVDEITNCIAMVVNEPSVTQKSGEWLTDEIIHNGCKYTVTYCSECDEQVDYRTPFCPNCGAKMVEPQERSDKE